jgi:PAS domain-containing protein
VTNDLTMLKRLLDNFKDAVCFCDTGHVIRYMNAAARERFAGRPAEVGRSIFDCHDDDSNAQIVEILGRLRAGETEVALRDDEVMRTYMRAVRDERGAVVGYYERYDPPRGR